MKNIWDMIHAQYLNQLAQGNLLWEPALAEDQSPIEGMSPAQVADVEEQMNPLSKYKRTLGPAQTAQEMMPEKNPWAIKGGG